MDIREVVGIIESAFSSSSIGPIPKFDEYHIIKLLMILSEEKAIGRVKLSKVLSIGEGTARTMLSRMRELGLIKESKKGCILTRLGREVTEIVKSKIPCVAEVPIEEFGIEGKGIGVLVRETPSNTDVVKLRDEAIKRGAKALITLVLMDERLAMPTVEDNVMAKWPVVANTILNTFKPSEGDAILIGIADDHLKAERGALMAAWILAFKWSA